MACAGAAVPPGSGQGVRQHGCSRSLMRLVDPRLGGLERELDLVVTSPRASALSTDEHSAILEVCSRTTRWRGVLLGKLT